MNRRGIPIALCLLMLAVLVTGCPRNEYIVELIPHGDTIERRLTFYRADGSDSNGVPSYQAFDADELAAITRFYPSTAVQHNGNRHLAVARFGSAMPADIGGAGSFTNVSTTLGSASFYLERFRGNDDLVAANAKRLHAADQLVDLVIGWSKKELGGERGYPQLHRFLDIDFRNDVKNLSLYGWMMAAAPGDKDWNGEEFAVRMGQYLVERGYLDLSDLPELQHVAEGNDGRPLMRLIQRMVAGKLGIPKSKPIPRSLYFLAEPDRALESWSRYLAKTSRYRALLHHWQAEQLKADAGTLKNRVRRVFDRNWTNSPSGTVNPPSKPEPMEVVYESAGELVGMNSVSVISSANDHLTVKLSLAGAPAHSNGKWDQSHGQLLWDSDLDQQWGRLPVFCYASWSVADADFQKRHFGRVILAGDALQQYCLWRAGLNAAQAGEWDALLAGLGPGDEIRKKLESFLFSNEAVSTVAVPSQQQVPSASEYGRRLILSESPEKAGEVEK
jgi:hypothetical protein